MFLDPMTVQLNVVLFRHTEIKDFSSIFPCGVERALKGEDNI